jgi:SAM-dependent methyltransferase
MTKHYSKFTNNYTKIYYKNELIVDGIRDPLTRIESIPVDFSNKTVLDLGCNCGGTLISIADKIKYGYGNDINPEAINFANKIINEQQIKNLNFSVANLENWEKLNLPKTDIVFALSIAKWVKSWKEILISLNPVICIFESHGKQEMKDDQIIWLSSRFKSVELILENYEDGKRKLFLCKQ